MHKTRLSESFIELLQEWAWIVLLLAVRASADFLRLASRFCELQKRLIRILHIREQLDFVDVGYAKSDKSAM